MAVEQPSSGVVYLVGGAVRDELLGRPVRERDWVVVGATAEQLIAEGFRRVGHDFPVFLHPTTHEEYALARTERKTGPGHKGFSFDAAPTVTLEQDLERRDLTINSIARAHDGRLIDPWHGRRDIEARVLRHVCAAFAEDPLRVFRVARFAAELASYDFTVAPETLELMSAMCRSGVVAELAAERVWNELAKALGGEDPRRFFAVLGACEGMTPWLAELAGRENVFGMLSRFDAALDRYGALGWSLAPEAAERLSARLRAPRDHRDLMHAVAEHGSTLATWRTADAAELLTALRATGGLKRADWFSRVATVVARSSEASLDGLVGIAAELRAVSSAPLRARGLTGAALGHALRHAMLDRLDALRR